MTDPIDTIVVLTFRNQTQVIGTVEMISDSDLYINQPYRAEHKGSGQFVLTPYCIFTDESLFKFNRSDIQSINPCRDDVSLKYLNITVSANNTTSHIDSQYH